MPLSSGHDWHLLHTFNIFNFFLDSTDFEFPVHHLKYFKKCIIKSQRVSAIIRLLCIIIRKSHSIEQFMFLSNCGTATHVIAIYELNMTCLTRICIFGSINLYRVQCSSGMNQIWWIQSRFEIANQTSESSYSVAEKDSLQYVKHIWDIYSDN